jgi:WD40 repeat protein
MNVRKVDTFSGHRDSVYTIISDHTLSGFFSAGGDGFIIHWDLAKPDLGKLVARAGVSVYALAHDENRGHLWIGQNFEGVQLLDLKSNEIINTLNITKSAIFDIQLVDEKALIALGDGVIVVMDMPTFSVQKHIKVAEKSIRSIAINEKTGEFTVGDSEHNIHIFDLKAFTLKQTIRSHTNSVFSVCYSPDGTKLITTGRDAHFKVWDVMNSYQLLHNIPAHLYSINHITFSPDATLLATCSMDKSIKLWDATTFKLIKVIDKARHAGHATSVNKLLWASFNNELISCSDDRQISIWEIEK